MHGELRPGQEGQLTCAKPAARSRPGQSSNPGEPSPSCPDLATFDVCLGSFQDTSCPSPCPTVFSHAWEPCRQKAGQLNTGLLHLGS